MDYPIKTKVISVKDIFSPKNSYVIPEYQRPYSWGEKNIDDFLSSTVNGFITGRPLFFGTVQYYLENEGSTRFEVIDGQQRMTTLILFFKLISLMTGKDYIGIDSIAENVNIRVSNVASFAFKQVLGMSDAAEASAAASKKEADENRQKNIYYRNIGLIKSGLDQYKKEKPELDLCTLAEFVLENVYVVSLMTVKMPLPEVVDIFNTINSTGMDLDSSDLFKLQYFDYLKKVYPDVDDWMHRINGCYELISQYSFDHTDNIHTYWILDTYKLILCAEFGLKYDHLSMSNERFFSEIFNNIQYRGNEILSFDAFDFLVRMFIEFFEIIYHPEAEKTEHDLDHLLCLMIDMTRYSRYWVMPFAEAFFRGKKLGYRIFDKELYTACYANSAVMSRYFAICSVNYAKAVNPVHTLVTNEVLPIIREAGNVSTLMRPKLALTPYQLSDANEEPYGKNDFIHNLKTDLFNNDKRCRIVCVLSDILYELQSQETCVSDIRNKLFDWKNMPYYIEHIFAREKFKERSDEEKAIYNSIGNLMVLERSINRSIGNMNLTEKLKKYTKSVYAVCGTVKTYGDLGDINNVIKRQTDETERICRCLFMED